MNVRITSLASRIALGALLVLSAPAAFASSVSTIAGSGMFGSTNGTGAAAEFGGPSDVCVDSSGNLYVADFGSNKIRKITPAGVVSTFAGGGTAGSSDGTGTAATFNHPASLCMDSSGNLYVADSDNNKIRKITSSRVVTTLAGSGAAGAADGTGTAASFRGPRGICIDPAGNLCVADTSNHRIRKITPAGAVTTLAGSGAAGYADGSGTQAKFNSPTGVCADFKGNVYVADRLNFRIRMVTQAGVVSTFAGSGQFGSDDGTGVAARFGGPFDLCSDSSGNLYLAEEGYNKIRKITSSAVVTSVAGTGVAGFHDGTAATAKFKGPQGLCRDAAGNVYVADTQNNRIRKISP